MGRARSEPKGQQTSVGDSTVAGRRASRKGAQVMGFPDQTLARQLLKVGGKFVVGGGPRGGLGGLRRRLPFKRAARAPSVTWRGEGLGKVCVCCWQSARWAARAGAAVLPFCFREAAGAAGSARRGGQAPGSRLPVPAGRRRRRKVGGGRARGAHARPALGVRGWRGERSRRAAQAEER